jgi:hypothetical protein
MLLNFGPLRPDRLNSFKRPKGELLMKGSPHTDELVRAVLDAKRDIVQNAIDLYTQIGLRTPRVAILSAVETVTTKIRPQ